MPASYRYPYLPIRLADQYRGAITVGPHLHLAVADITCTGDEFLVGRGVIDRLRLIFDQGRQLIVDD